MVGCIAQTWEHGLNSCQKVCHGTLFQLTPALSTGSPRGMARCRTTPQTPKKTQWPLAVLCRDASGRYSWPQAKCRFSTNRGLRCVVGVVATTRWTCSSRKLCLLVHFFRGYMSSFREGMKARSGIHARLRARHRKQEAVDEKRHQCMKLNIQTASDHAVLELSFHRHFPRARRLKLRQRLEFPTRFPSHTHDDTHTTHT